MRKQVLLLLNDLCRSIGKENSDSSGRAWHLQLILSHIIMDCCVTKWNRHHSGLLQHAQKVAIARQYPIHKRRSSVIEVYLRGILLQGRTTDVHVVTFTYGLLCADVGDKQKVISRLRRRANSSNNSGNGVLLSNIALFWLPISCLENSWLNHPGDMVGRQIPKH